jgi:adenylosuccinate lyase
MYNNIGITGGLAFSEVVMLELGKSMRRLAAHDVVYRISMQLAESGGSFREALLSDPSMRAHFTPDQIDTLLQPERYLGAAPDGVDRVTGNQPIANVQESSDL